jgi:signal transduction histidine kinase
MGFVVAASVLVLVWMTGLILSSYIEPVDYYYDYYYGSGIGDVRFHWTRLVQQVVPAWAFGIAGTIAWRRRPTSRIGPLMAIIGASLLIWGLRGLSIPPLVSLGLWMSQGPAASGFLLGVLVLAYPSGRIASRLDRAWVALGLGWLLVVQLVWSLATPVGFWGCVDCVPLIVVWYHEGTRLALQNLSILIFTALAAVLFLLLIRRWLRASGPARRVLAPVWLAGMLVPAVALTRAIIDTTGEQLPAVNAPIPFIGAFLRGRIPPVVWDVLPWVVAASLLLVPLALLWGLLRGHLGQAAVGALAVELRQPGRQASLTESLRRALGDRSLEVLLWSRPAGEYVTSEGVPVPAPVATTERSVTRLDSVDGPLAALVHDPFLEEQRSLVDGASAVAQFALENERLHAEVKAQLEEVRASRERIVRAGDEERRRVERNIHDGAQQRLVSLSLALSMAQAKAAQTSPEVVETLAAAEVELKEAIGELRELARGIHPAILTEAGLRAALESLAERSPVPVIVHTNLDGPLPPLVEATAYFVVAEALTNAARHASASSVSLTVNVDDGWLRLIVADDGQGGADPARGSGLRGLLDRVAALGGRLSIEQAGSGGGTRLRAEIPCA